MSLIDVIEYAKEKHAETNGLDKTGKTPYYWHLLRVMLRIKDATEEQMMVAILHDVLEDTNATEQELRERFGDNVTNSVIWCSKNFFPELSFKDWMKKIAQEGDENAIIVKLADISDNLCFERMRGLIPAPPNTPYVYVRDVNPNVQKRIDSITRKKMKLRGEMGVFDRYYVAWNILLDNPNNAHLINKIHTNDFVNLEQLQKISQYIPKEEFINYLEFNKINTWKISGEIKLHHDKVGQPYIAAEINRDTGLMYQDILEQTLGAESIENQRKRDTEQFHVTIINAADFNKLKKNQTTEDILKNFENIDNSFFTYGIGKNSKNDNTAHYVILENNYINTIRSQLGLHPHDLHMTLGFKEKDVHGVRKNRATVEIDNQSIWKDFVNKKFNAVKKSTKLKF